MLPFKTVPYWQRLDSSGQSGTPHCSLLPIVLLSFTTSYWLLDQPFPLPTVCWTLALSYSMFISIPLSQYQTLHPEAGGSKVLWWVNLAHFWACRLGQGTAPHHTHIHEITWHSFWVGNMTMHSGILPIT